MPLRTYLEPHCQDKLNPRSQCLASCGPRPNSVADSRLRLTGLSCAVLKLTAETMRLQLGSFLTLDVAGLVRI